MNSDSETENYMGVQTLEDKWVYYLQKNCRQGFAERLRYKMHLHFGSLPVGNRSVLEIGAGEGFLSAFCAARGASRVVALEPEAAGSTNGVRQEFARMSSALGRARLHHVVESSGRPNHYAREKMRIENCLRILVLARESNLGYYMCVLVVRQMLGVLFDSFGSILLGRFSDGGQRILGAFAGLISGLSYSRSQLKKK